MRPMVCASFALLCVVAQTPDGALLVTGDENGAVYLIGHRLGPVAGN
jgi:hypothetical protein